MSDSSRQVWVVLQQFPQSQHRPIFRGVFATCEAGLEHVHAIIAESTAPGEWHDGPVNGGSHIHHRIVGTELLETLRLQRYTIEEVPS